MKFSELVPGSGRGSEGGWPARGRRLGLASCLLRFLLIQLIRSQRPGKPPKCRKSEGGAKSGLQLGFRRQNLIWAVGANCFHMKEQIQNMSMEVPADVRASCANPHPLTLMRALPSAPSLLALLQVHPHPWKPSGSGPGAH